MYTGSKTAGTANKNHNALSFPRFIDILTQKYQIVVIPAEAGIHMIAAILDSCFHRNDRPY
jgi:hypothetical protein